jgi:predicted dienelactone hydrolase
MQGHFGQNLPMRASYFLTSLLAVVLAATSAPPAQAQDKFKAGLADIIATDPVDGVKMSGLVTYPTNDLGEPTQIAMFTVNALRRAAMAPGRFPLIIFSHNTGGSRLDNHDSLEALTRAGFIAAAIEHPRDNYRDQTGSGTDRQLIGRSHHVKAFIDGLLSDPVIGPAIDKTRIGIVGFAVGGYTALTSIGGKPNLALVAAYAKAMPTDPIIPIITNAAAQRKRPGFEVLTDTRIRAAFLMAPALGFLFDSKALANVKVPVRLYRAGKDGVMPEPYNVENIRKSLPTPPEFVVAEGMGHFIFFSPCSPELTPWVKWMCEDAPGIDRVAFHQKLNAEMVDFFHRTLDVP